MSEPKMSFKGKRFKKRLVIELEDTSENVEAACNTTQSVLKMLEDMVIYAKKTLANKGYDTSQSVPIFRGIYFDRESMSNEERANKKKENLFIESDSEEADLVNLWQCCEIAANKKNNIENRLDYAFRAGDYFRRLAVYADYGKSQSKSAQQPRASEVDKIIARLAAKDASAKELWLEFFGELDNEGLSPRDDSENNIYFYGNNKEKPKKIAFGTFSNRLSQKRKR